MQLLCVLLLAWARARAPIPVSDGPSGGSTRLPLARGGERGALPAAVALLFDAPTIRRDPAVGPRSRAYSFIFCDDDVPLYTSRCYKRIESIALPL